MLGATYSLILVIFELLFIAIPTTSFLSVSQWSRRGIQYQQITLNHFAKKKKGNNQKTSRNDDLDDDDDDLLLNLLDHAIENTDKIGNIDKEIDENEYNKMDYREDTDIEDDGVVSSIDEIEPDEDEQSLLETSISSTRDAAWQADVTEIIKTSIISQPLALNKLTFLPNRIEIIVVGASDNGDSDGDDEGDYLPPDVDAIKSLHRDLYNRFELREADLDVVARFEVVVASPGIGQHLRSKRDFETFRGFPVLVAMKEEYKKKKQFEGTLVERDDEHVSLSLKGRIVKIPRLLIDSVSLPKPKFESTDSEMRKLR